VLQKGGVSDVQGGDPHSSAFAFGNGWQIDGSSIHTASLRTKLPVILPSFRLLVFSCLFKAATKLA
jgi:hypothetical protein